MIGGSHPTIMDDGGLLGIILTSFMTSGSATFFAAIVGIPLAWWCSRSSHPSLLHIRRVVHALYGLPPVVVGVFVYSLLSKRGPLGGLELLFTVEAMIFAQFIIILPLIWGGAWHAFESTQTKFNDALYSIGLHGKERFRAEIKLSSRGISHAIILGFGRAIAEVGAVIIVGGNIAGKTRVMTTSIVLETSKGNTDMAMKLGIILLLCTFVVLFLASISKKNVFRKNIILREDSGLPSTLKFGSPQPHSITVTKGGKTIINGVDITLESGKIIVLVGPSGSGKTTILRYLAGLEGFAVEYGPGSCIWMPQQPIALRNTVIEERSIASDLYPNLPVCSEYLMKKFCLEVDNNQLIEDLSGGEVQRLVLLRQFSLQPSLLLLDECTASLDGESVRNIENEILRMRGEGCSIVLATHNILQAKRLADEIIVLNKGKALDHEDVVAQSILSGEFFG
jgi:tungstate transport system ATP-binding protein